MAATNRNLLENGFRARVQGDLYYRLNVFPIVSPPLRERQEDVANLVRYFTQKFARRMNKPIATIPAATMTALSQYHWPGNIRELQNFIERAVILSRGSNLEAPLGELEKQATDRPAEDSRQSTTLTTLEEAEREHIRRALQQANWLVGGPSGVAAKLGMKRTTLQSRMRKLGIAARAALSKRAASLSAAGAGAAARRRRVSSHRL